MRLLIQRVSEASVAIEGSKYSEISRGLLILIGIEEDDTEKDADWLAAKASSLRVFPDEQGVMNLSVKDVDGEALVVSQFTLTASTRKGNRPSYIRAARHETAIPLYEYFCRKMSELIGKKVATGRFGADMQVALTNDGPVTIMIDSRLRE